MNECQGHTVLPIRAQRHHAYLRTEIDQSNDWWWAVNDRGLPYTRVVVSRLFLLARCKRITSSVNGMTHIRRFFAACFR